MYDTVYTLNLLLLNYTLFMCVYVLWYVRMAILKKYYSLNWQS